MQSAQQRSLVASFDTVVGSTFEAITALREVTFVLADCNTLLFHVSENCPFPGGGEPWNFRKGCRVYAGCDGEAASMSYP